MNKGVVQQNSAHVIRKLRMRWHIRLAVLQVRAGLATLPRVPMLRISLRVIG